LFVIFNEQYFVGFHILRSQYVNFDNVVCGLRFSGSPCTAVYTLPCETS